MKTSPRNRIPQHNLPSPLSTFIGREREIREVSRLISSHRLVTLTGAGGSGKTRLSLKVADGLHGEFEHGIWLVELASISDAEFVSQAVASTFNIHEQPGQSVLEVLVHYLSARQILIILDNCEHLISACAQLTEILLQKCPDLKILATSREVLAITGEMTWTIPPLSLPGQQPWKNPASAQDAINLYEESESVQLFVARAIANSTEFKLTAENGAWVAEICRNLDGMPLAIELAAARVRSLSVQEIAQRLDDRFRLLTGGSRTAPPRHQTLAATLDWSYALLSVEEQNMLQRLAVFAGGATLEAAESVCSGRGIESEDVLPLLSSLIDKSLVTVEGHAGSETRYRLLETIRQYALDKLVETGEVDESRERHLRYFTQRAEEAANQVDGPGQPIWLAWYEAEHDNLRASLEWCNVTDRVEEGLRLAAACGRFWRLHGFVSEGRVRLSNALSRKDAQARTRMRASALMYLANLMYLQSDYPAMRPIAEEALSIWREVGESGRAGAAHTLDLLGELETEEGNYDRALLLFQEALDIYDDLHDPGGIGQIHMQFGWAAMRTGDYEQAEDHLNRFLSLARQAGDQTSIAFAFSGLGEVALRQGQYERATSLLESGLELNRRRGDKWGTATLLGSLGWVALRQKDYKQMRERLGESLSIRVELEDKGGTAWCLEKLAEAKYEGSQFHKAAKIFGHAESVRAPIRSVIDPADQPEYLRIISGLGDALGTDVFAALWSEGGALSLDDAIQLALSESPTESTPSSKEIFGGLTAREREVAALIAQGKSNREIAQAMTVRAKTVETYVTRILNKLGLNSRVQIATWAMEKGLK